MEDVVQEQERQMEMLHRNVNILQASMDISNNASSHKIENHLRDNQNLLKEVNNLRFEVCYCDYINGYMDRLMAILLR